MLVLGLTLLDFDALDSNGAPGDPEVTDFASLLKKLR